MKKNKRFHVAYSINDKCEMLECTSPFPTKGQAMSFLKRHRTWLSRGCASVHTKSFPGEVKDILKSFEYGKFMGGMF